MTDDVIKSADAAAAHSANAAAHSAIAAEGAADVARTLANTTSLAAAQSMQTPPWPRTMQAAFLAMFLGFCLTLGGVGLFINHLADVVQQNNHGTLVYQQNAQRAQRLFCSILSSEHAAPPVNPVTHKSDCAP